MGQKDFHLISDNSYLYQNVLCILVKPARVEWIIHTDRLEKLLFILAMERRLANKHLIQEDTKWPPVNGSVVFLPQQYLPKDRRQRQTYNVCCQYFSFRDVARLSSFNSCFALNVTAEVLFLPEAWARAPVSVTGAVVQEAPNHSNTCVPEQYFTLWTIWITVCFLVNS